MNKRLNRLEMRVFRPYLYDETKDKGSFWRGDPRRWDALGLLAMHGFKCLVIAVRLYEEGGYEVLKKFFVRSLLPNWEQPTPAQLQWGVEAVGRMKDEYRSSDWWEDANAKVDAWLLEKQSALSSGQITWLAHVQTKNNE